MAEDTGTRRGWSLGPGILVAATGVGAGDLIAAAVAGREYGLAVLWVVAVGAACKWALNEGVARWQLATGSSLITGWARHLPNWVSWYFGAYLLVWSLLVGAALGSSCGVAIKALFPALPGGVGVWAVGHAFLGLALVLWGKFAWFEKIMQALVGLMFVVVVVCGIMLVPSWSALLQGLLWPQVPAGGLWLVLGLMGGVGGSATLLCYGYWMREKRWQGQGVLGRARWDLGVAYTLTGIFGVAMVVLAAGAQPGDESGSALVVALAGRLEELLGQWGHRAFLVGFWCAVFSSLLGVWQGVPYLFADWWKSRGGGHHETSVGNHSRSYRGFLLYLAIVPLCLQWLDRPLFLVVLYAVAGAFFMPLLAGTLLVLNNRVKLVRELRNPSSINAVLGFSLLVFGLLLVQEVLKRFF
jgi:Mn2+/Fe2+ NRAMP family transporter